MIVDARPSVLELAEQALRDDGHQVLVTHDPAEVAELMEVVRVDLVIATTRMLERLRRNERCPALLEIAHAGRRVQSGSMLQTPFTLGELQHTVARALEASSVKEA